MGELPVETAVPSPSYSGGVVQLEGTVNCQLRMSCLTSGGRLTPKIAMSSGEECSLSDMGRQGLFSFASSTPAFMCDTVLGFFFLKSARASSACMSFQLTH